MADLDDFFAKKDRKKSKSVKKFSTTDEVTKKLDEPKLKSEVRPKKDRPAQEGEEGSRKKEEEEWKEYEEPVKDYTGLKIQVLQGGANQQETQELECQEQAGADNGKSKGPWNKPEAVKPPAPRAPAPAPAPAPTGAYVPPVARNRPEPVVNRRAQQKHAPDIHNDDYFPVLGAAASARRPGGEGWSTQGGAGGAPARGATAAARPLALGNQFSGLQDDS